MKNFALTGVAGFVAQRHLRAIRDVGGILVASHDISDSVGIIDSYFPYSYFTTSFADFEKKLAEDDVNFLSVCTPNFLHKEHSIYGLQYGCDVICDKPLVLNAADLYKLQENEKEYNRKVYTILQLRLHPAIIALRERVLGASSGSESGGADGVASASVGAGAGDGTAFKGKRFQAELKYITSRGQWYFTSWKGDVARSGGLATNIGIHFFDMLLWIFGAFESVKLDVSTPDVVSGMLHLEKADVKFFLSINDKYLPEVAVAAGKRTFRSLEMEGEQIEFSDGFTDLHTESYRKILAGDGFTLEDARPSVELVERIRELSVVIP